MNTEESRKQFELSGLTASLYRNNEPGRYDEYEDPFTQFAWVAWQAAQPQWIPVSERLPENNSGIYLCSGHEGTKFICHRRNNEWIRSPQMKRVVGITHWMPLPELPEAVK